MKNLFCTIALSLCCVITMAQRLEERLEAPLEPGQTIEIDGVTYVAGVNLISNPSFDQVDADGNYPGWTSGTYEALNSQFFTRETYGGYDGGACITSTQNSGANTAGALANRWKVTPYTMYYFSYQIKGLFMNEPYIPVLTLTSINSTAGGQNEGTPEAQMLIGKTDYQTGIYGYSSYTADGDEWMMTALAFSSDKDVFLQFNARYLYNYGRYVSFDDFRLMQLYPVDVEDRYTVLKKLFDERYTEATKWAETYLSEKYPELYEQFVSLIAEYAYETEDADEIQYNLMMLEETMDQAKTEYSSAESMSALLRTIDAYNLTCEEHFDIVESCENLFDFYNTFIDQYSSVKQWWEGDEHYMGQYLTYYDILREQLHPIMAIEAVVRLGVTIDSVQESAKPSVIEEAEEYYEKLRTIYDVEELFAEIPTIEEYIKRLNKIYRIRIHMGTTVGTFATRLAEYVDNFDEVEWLLVTGMMNAADCNILNSLNNLEWLDLSGITSMEIGSTLTLRVDSLSNTNRPSIKLGINHDRGYLHYQGTDTLSMSQFTFGLDHSGRNSSCLINDGMMGAENVKVTYINPVQKWDFVSFPFNVKVADIKPMFNNQDICIREYSGENRAAGDMDQTWIDVTPDATLKARQGYIIQSPTRYNDWGTPDYSAWEISAVRDEKMNDIFNNDTISVELQIFATDDTFAHNRSWNLIGNPYPSMYDIRHLGFDGPITVWNSYYSTYQTYTVNDRFALRPGGAFFVQRPTGEDGRIIFYPEGRTLNGNIASHSPAHRTPSHVTSTDLNISITDGRNLDNTRVTISENALTTYEIGVDAAKFMSPVKSVPQIYTHDIEVCANKAEQVTYSVNERPVGNGTVKLGLYIPVKGEYTISIEAGDVLLEDIENGSFTNLSSEMSYTFTAKEGIQDDRFILHLGNSITGINKTSIDNETDNKSYNIAGQRVSNSSKGLIIKSGSKVLKY